MVPVFSPLFGPLVPVPNYDNSACVVKLSGRVLIRFLNKLTEHNDSIPYIGHRYPRRPYCNMCIIPVSPASVHALQHQVAIVVLLRQYCG